MAADIVVPTLGESVTEATVAQWLKQAGDQVEADEPLVELETDKVTLEVNAPASGVLQEIKAKEGASVEVGTILGIIGEGKGAVKATQPRQEEKTAPSAPPVPQPQPAAAPVSVVSSEQPLAPAVRKLLDENGIDPSEIQGTGKDGRILKADVLNYLERKEAPRREGAGTPPPLPKPVAANDRQPDTQGREERVKMTRLRQRIAERLKQAQNTAAMLTTFNEIDMSACMKLRAEYKDQFEKKHGIKLGFMSFFVKAAVLALQEIPAVNAEIQGDEIVYKNYYDIGVAVSTPTGLVVPVIRGADGLSFAGIESVIADMGGRARDGKLSIEEMTGGTFTITNGGVFGSLNSTPILNPPQSGILGMHKIQERPIAVKGEVVVRPMMYVALSYDHRIIDGREAVTFLVRIKEAIEDPQRLLLDV